MNAGVVIAIGVALATSGLLAQPGRTSTNREAQLRQQIGELQTETGLARPEGVIDPLRALALLYEEDGDHARATATLEEARYVARVHNGLTSAEEALLLRQQIRSEKALGLHERAWDLEQEMVTTARHHHDDIRMLPIFRELAEDRLAVIDKVSLGERPPMIYAGCYNGEPPPPYDYTRGEWHPRVNADAPSFTTPSCFGGINQDLISKLRGETLMYYADAIETILRGGDYASPELRELERDAVRLRGGRRFNTALSAKGSGSLRNCPAGTLEEYLALEILDSCLAPVSRGQGFVIANVGNPLGLIRLVQYETRSAGPATARADAIAELADWYVVYTPAERRRFLLPEVVFTLYERAYEELRQDGELQASTEMFAPDLPITLPTYEPNPFESAATESPRYIDVSFAVTKLGLAERIEILGTSKGATRGEKHDMVRLIETTSFRPRIVDGVLADSAPVTLRYLLGR
jgi:hypothetical protein